MVKNRGLRSTVNKTLEKLESLCGRYDSCVKYVRKINDVKATPKTPTADANICCQADTPLCKACHEGISVEEYLKKHEAHVPKITMLIVNDMKHKEKYRLNTKNLNEYAKSNNYVFVEKTPGDEERCNDVKNFFFKKHCIVYYYMVDSVNNNGWIFVLDGDNYVRNPNTNIKLESFVKDKKDIMYYYRFHNNEIAAGNYAIKNTQWSQDYLKAYYELHNTYKGFNADNGALHYYLLPDKKRCDKFYRNPSSSVTLYDKYVGCVHKELQAANFPLEEHIFVYKHGKAWTYDGWVVDNKWSKDTLMHHAIKKPQNENKYTDEKELKNLLEKSLVRERKKRPNTGWEYTKDAWNVGKNIIRQNVVLVPMVYDHLKLFNEGLRKQIKDAISVIYISGIGHKECPVIDNHYVQCEKEYKLKAVGLNILFKYVAKKYPKNTLVTIMDADDTFSPCTLKQIEMFYAKHNPKVLFHSVSRTDIVDQKCKDPQLTHDGVYLYDYAKKTEGQRLHLFDHAHHGHITMDISVALDINHKAIPRAGTDTHFMRDVIKKYGRKKDTIMFTEDIYTIYKISRDAWMKTVKHSRKIMIGIPMKNRRGYVKFHAKILTQYNKIDSKDIFIFDDFSDEYGEEELRNWYGKDIHYFRSEKALGADGNTRLLFNEFLKSEYDILLTLDSDLLMKNNWKEFIHDNIDESGVISLYHSKAPHHKTTDCNGKRCRKHSMGNAAAVMTKDIVRNMLKEHNNYQNFDWGWVEYFKKHGIHMYVPQNSIVMHYGKVGQNNDCENVLEVAKNFDRSHLPDWIKSGLEYYFDKCSDPSTSYIKDKTKELSIDETFNMLESGHSISRFGDGEITLMQGTSIRFQKHTPLLQKKLLEIKNDKKFCIGIVPILHGIPSYFQEHTRQFFTQYIPKYRKIFTEDSYCNAFISRKDNVNGYSRKYFEEKWNKVFDNKNVLVIHSSEISTTDSSVFKRHLKSAKSVTYMSDNIPKVNAFSSYDTIMKNAIQQIDKNNIDITVISLGPTATVMAYDLYKQGYTALDVGQFSGDYSPIDENRKGNQNAKKKKLLFIIPFRDRHKHFHSFKQHVKRLSSKFAVDVYVVEQANKDYFNRAWLLNVGLKEAKLRNVVYDCVITSDVDIFGDVDYSWCDRPTHICSEMSCHGNSVPYAANAGGVVTAKLSDWETINGYTNKAVGWGGEDDDLFYRFRQAKLLTGKTLRRPAKGKGKCDCLHDEDHTKRVRHQSSYANIKKQIERMSQNSKEWKTDGLNNLEYNLMSVKQMNDDGFSVIWYKATSMKNVGKVIISGKTITYKSPLMRSSDIVVGILSYDKKKRQLIRDKFDENIYFIVGKQNGNFDKDEFEKYNDIIVLDEEESYMGEDTILPYKTQVFFHAVHSKVKAYKYVLKIDDDSLVDFVALRKELKRVKPAYWGFVFKNAPVVRDTKNKWYISKSTYVDDNYPDYCSGGGYVLSRKSIDCVVTKLGDSLFMPNEDVATGILAKKCEIYATHTNKIKSMKSQSGTDFIISHYYTWKTDEKKKYVGVELKGGLGNNLFQLASTIGVAKRNKATPCYTGTNKAVEFVNTHIAKCPGGHFEKQKERGYATFTPFDIDQSTKISEYLQSYKYFANTPPFVVKQSMNKFARAYIQSHSNAKTNVGIHIRRGDHLKLGYLRFPSSQYFENAMEYFRNKYKDVQFFVASDDIAWCQKQPVFTEAHIISEKHTAAQDLSILANCDHVIISLGTFGWWGGLLSGGEVVYNEDEFDMNHKINKGNIVKDDYYPTAWVSGLNKESPQACVPTKGMWHVMIIWGHGLSDYDSIMDMVHVLRPSVRVWFQKMKHINSIDSFVKQVYNEDVVRVGASHIAAKTKYLQNTGDKIGVIVLFDPNPDLKSYGTGKWKIMANKRMVDLKWNIRRKFNPNPTGKLKRDSKGVFSHHHVVHVSDTDEGVDSTLKILEFPTTSALQRTHRDFFTPWFITPPKKYKVEMVKVSTLKIGCGVSAGKCVKGSSVKVSDSPHYAFASGDEDVYASYYTSGRLAGVLTDDHTVESFHQLQKSFDPNKYPSCMCGYDGVQRKSMILIDKNGRIMDGAHRASILLANDIDSRVPVVRMGVEGQRVKSCQRNNGIITKKLNFKSQKGQDAWIYNILNEWSSKSPYGSQWKGRSHFYVDLAANDPYHLSSTAFFDKIGWEGICIDGNSKYTDAIRASKRTCAVVEAIVDACMGKEIQWADNGVLGGIVSDETDNKKASSGTKKGISTTLEHILDLNNAPRVIDFLSLDVEGSEFRIMEHFPFDKYSFLTIAIERPPPWLNELLFKNGYLFAGLSSDGFDSYYVNQLLSDVVDPNIKFHQVENKCIGKPGSKCAWPNTVPLKTVCSDIISLPQQIAMTWIQNIQKTTRLAVFKYADNFPDNLKSENDVDVLVESITKAIDAIRRAPFGNNIRVEELHDATQAHVDYMRENEIVMRLDLYEQFSFPDVSERKAPTPDDIFKQSVTVTSDKGWVWTHTSLEHECRLRWMEWAQWHKKRPDKIKHLKWMEKHGCNHNIGRNVEQKGNKIVPNVMCTIEVPKGSTIKYEAGGMSRTLAKPMIANYGFVPNTLVSAERRWDGGMYGDGDPLDCIVVGDALPVNTTTRMDLQGVLKMEDHGKFDWKLVGRREDHLPRSDLSRTEWDELQTWFATYKTMVNIRGFGSRNDALTLWDHTKIKYI